MNPNYRAFDNFKEQDRRDLFEAAAVSLGNNAQAIEKDFWVCRVIDALFKGLLCNDNFDDRSATIGVTGSQPAMRNRYPPLQRRSADRIAFSVVSMSNASGS